MVQSSAKGLAVYLANINNPVKYLGDYGDYWWVNEAWGWNDTEIPCIVAVIDDKGRPIEWNGPDDLRVTLTASEGGFYTDDYSVSAPEGSVEITIPKGYTGVELYYLRSQPSANPQENDLLTAQTNQGFCSLEQRRLNSSALGHAPDIRLECGLNAGSIGKTSL